MAGERRSSSGVSQCWLTLTSSVTSSSIMSDFRPGVGEERLYLTQLFSLWPSLREKTPEEAELLPHLPVGGRRQLSTDTATDLRAVCREAHWSSRKATLWLSLRFCCSSSLFSLTTSLSSLWAALDSPSFLSSLLCMLAMSALTEQGRDL